MRASKNSVPPFIQKLWELLQDTSLADILSWTPSGTSFQIKDKQKFQQFIPLHFKHSKYLSFVRQLNMYDFKKIRGATYDQFYHKLFKRQGKSLLIGIKRKPSQEESEFANLLIQKYEIDHPPKQNLEDIKKQEIENENLEKQQKNFDEKQEMSKKLEIMSKQNEQLRVQINNLKNQWKKLNDKIVRDNEKLFRYFTAVYTEEYHSKYSKQLRQYIKNHPLFVHLASEESPLSPEYYLIMQNYIYPQYNENQLSLMPQIFQSSLIPSNLFSYSRI